MRLEISPRPATGAAFRRVRALALATSAGLGLALAPAAWAQTASPAPLLQPQTPGSALPSFAPSFTQFAISVFSSLVRMRWS